jgi:hypothetical protein
MPRLTNADKARQTEYAETLRKWLAPVGTNRKTVYAINRHTSRSGLMRHLDFYVFVDNDRVYLSGYIAAVLDMPRTKDGAIKVAGCGMDMGFHIVYNLGATLWPAGTDEPHGTRNSESDREGGYAIRSDWL